MADLWMLIPSRGRPDSVARAVRSYALTCRADTRIHFGFDDDDPCLADNVAAAGPHRYTIGPRAGLTEWTNALATAHLDDAVYLGSFGDDHVPVTDGWDTKLIAAVEEHCDGIGMAYPDDKVRDDIPTAIIISTPIVRALGWMALPTSAHWYIDTVWGALGAAAGCLVYCDDVVVEHRHYVKDQSLVDATYLEADSTWDADEAGWQQWRQQDMARDVATITALRAGTTSRPRAS